MWWVAEKVGEENWKTLGRVGSFLSKQRLQSVSRRDNHARTLRHAARRSQRVQAAARAAPTAVLPKQLQGAVRQRRVRAQAVPGIRC